MKSGSLIRPITLTHVGAETGRNKFNAPVYGAPVTIDLLAEYEPVSDAEKFAASEVAASLSARFRVRWTPTVAAVDPTWTLTFNGREFNIISVKEVGYRVGLEITAATRADK